MKHFHTAVLATVGSVVVTAAASAAVVCNDEGNCWRTTERLTYPLTLESKSMATIMPSDTMFPPDWEMRGPKHSSPKTRTRAPNQDRRE